MVIRLIQHAYEKLEDVEYVPFEPNEVVLEPSDDSCVDLGYHLSKMFPHSKMRHYLKHWDCRNNVMTLPQNSNRLSGSSSDSSWMQFLFF